MSVDTTEELIVAHAETEYALEAHAECLYDEAVAALDRAEVSIRRARLAIRTIATRSAVS